VTSFSVYPAGRSLIPVPFTPPVFDCLQYAKKEMEGEGLGNLFT